VVYELDINLDAAAGRWIGEPLGDSDPMDLVGDFLPELGQVILTIGVLDVAQEISPFVNQVGPPSHEVSGGSHLWWIDVGHGQHAAAQQCCDLHRVDAVVLDFASVDRFHIEGMAQDEGDLLFLAEISQPVPGEDTLDGDGDVITIVSNDGEERIRLRWEIAVDHSLSGLIEDAYVQGSGMEIDPTVVAMLCGIESHEASFVGEKGLR